MPHPIFAVVCVVGVFLLSGCTSLFNKDASDGNQKSLAMLTVPDAPELVRQAAQARGLNAIPVEGIGLVNSLNKTGGPADPSAFRDQLVNEMRRNDIRDPNSWLESDETAMVRILAAVPPGARRGDPIDLKIITPRGSRATDLNGGWLLDTRLRHQQRIANEVHKSDLLMMGTGAIVTRKTHQAGDAAALSLEGRILGGGGVQSTRKLGFVLRPDYQHVKMASGVASAINRRFFFFDGTTRRGIAKAIEDDFVQVEVHPRYRNNVYRMMAVAGATHIRASTAETQQRLAQLGQQLDSPDTAADAALQLEGIGESAIPMLTSGAESTNPELRFYAAEALAYLDREEAIEPLLDLIRNEAAFRQPAFTALEGMQHGSVTESLAQLLIENSLETRYAAFRTLRERLDGDQVLAGKVVGDALRLYSVSTPASPAVVISLRQRPEIVLFGDVHPLQMEGFVLGPGNIVIKPDPNDASSIRISRFAIGKDDRRAKVSSTIQGLIEGVVSVGGGYGDVIAILREMKTKGYLDDHLAIDPLPEALRTYYRDDYDSDDVEEDEDDLG